MARVYRPRFDPQLAEAFKRVSAGLAVKTLGYLFIVGGIFSSLKGNEIALMIVVVGIFLVIMGWLRVWRGLKKSATSAKENRESNGY